MPEMPESLKTIKGERGTVFNATFNNISINKDPPKI